MPGLLSIGSGPWRHDGYVGLGQHLRRASDRKSAVRSLPTDSRGRYSRTQGRLPRPDACRRRDGKSEADGASPWSKDDVVIVAATRSIAGV